jgi:hypothetical protein
MSTLNICEFSFMFLDNKYTKTYYRIIHRAKARTKPEGYTEKHHIIPKCKPLCGPNTRENLVALTFKEHWVCHHLLLKMVEGILKSKMYCAFKRMGQTNGKQDKVINSKMFERIKTANRALCSGKNNPRYGKHHSEESKRKISESNKGNKPTEEQRKKLIESHKGYVPSEESKRKNSESNKGKHNIKRTEEGKRNMSLAHKGLDNHQTGRKRSEETKQKLILAWKKRKLKGEIPWNKGGKNLYSDEIRKKMSDSHKGKKLSEEQKKKISLSLLGNKRALSQENKNKLC